MKTFKLLPWLLTIIGLVTFLNVASWAVCTSGTLTGTWNTSTVTSYANTAQTVLSGQADDYNITNVSNGELTLTVANIDNAQDLTATLYSDGTCGTNVWTQTLTQGQTVTKSSIVSPGTYTLYIIGNHASQVTDYNVSGTFVPVVKVGFQNITYQTSEDVALAYGLASQMSMNIVLDHAVAFPVSVHYQTYDGTAIGDSDYRIAGGTVTIPAGQTSVTVNMDIYHDEPIELDESFSVVLSNPVGTGQVVLDSAKTTAAVTILGQTTAPMCYSDNFNAASLDSTWRTLYSSGGFTPATVNNRLRMTTATGNLATAVTKDYEFPSSQNILIVEFTHYAYSGNGADGLAMVLYDSAVGATPTPGAFGGSLGYAQKCKNGTYYAPYNGTCSSDCTLTGGCSGFQGGWLGLGIDEYGNYQNPTEGRIGGTAFRSNAISIRGDGSGISGYEYLAGTTSQTPALWNSGSTASPGDKFRMTVDARDTAHLYIRLERDTGSGYQTIINQFDAKNIAYAQSTTPAFIRLALTASTGGSYAIHEIDNITVWGRCTPYTPNPGIPPANTGAVDVIDNYPINGYASQKGLATKITSKPGNILDAVWLGTVGGGIAMPYYTAGNNDVVDMPVLFYVSDINGTNDNGVCSTERYQLMGANGSPLVATFHAGDTYARTTSTFTVQNSAKQDSKIVPKYINFYGMNLLDPSITCLINSSNSGNIAGLPQCVNSENQYLSAFGQPAVDRCRNDLTKGQPCVPSNHGVGAGEYNHDYGCYQCTLDALGTKGCSSDAFAIRPDKFVITSNDTAMPNLLRAGQEYNNTINAYNYNTTTNTIDYNVSSAMSVFNLVTTKYNRNNVITASMAGTATLPTNDLNMSNGLSIGSGVGGNEAAGLIFGDVGKINLSLQDRIWSAVDNDDIPSALNCSGTYICSDKNVTFIPDHFDFNELNITNNNGNPGLFTYIANEFTQMGGRIHAQMRALNKNGNVTQNFASNPLWENPVSVSPVVRTSNYLYPDANETVIVNLPIGFGGGSDANGTKTIVWNETNTSQYLRFNFKRDVNPLTPPSPFNVNGLDLNITVESPYTDPEDGDTALISGSRNGTAGGSSQFVYGRIMPRDVRTFGSGIFSASAWYEVFGTTAIGATVLPISKNSTAWSTNTLHNDANDGDSNVTVVITGANPVSAAAVNGVETYTFGAGYTLGGYKAHIRTAPWLWYGTTALPYLDPANAANLDCLTHPCFNLNAVPAIGATGSAKSMYEGTKASKVSAGGAGTWKSTSDYAPAIR